MKEVVTSMRFQTLHWGCIRSQYRSSLVDVIVTGPLKSHISRQYYFSHNVNSIEHLNTHCSFFSFLHKFLPTRTRASLHLYVLIVAGRSVPIGEHFIGSLGS